MKEIHMNIFPVFLRTPHTLNRDFYLLQMVNSVHLSVPAGNIFQEKEGINYSLPNEQQLSFVTNTT